MPLSDKLIEVYVKAIEPACREAGWDAMRIDELSGPFTINRKIIEYIFTSNAIIADLTSYNPYVLYQMGVAHAISNKTIMISQDTERLPFDSSAYRVIVYKHMDELKKQLSDQLKQIDEGSAFPDNPVQDFKPFDLIKPNITTELQKKEKAIVKDQEQIRELKEKLAEINKEIDTIKKKLAAFRTRKIS